jgi:hypothetical protein
MMGLRKMDVRENKTWVLRHDQGMMDDRNDKQSQLMTKEGGPESKII